MATQTRVKPGGRSPAARPAGKARHSDTAVRSAGLALTLLAVAVLGFVGYLYLLSGVQEARAQTELYARLRGELAAGTAPVMAPIPGSVLPSPSPGTTGTGAGSAGTGLGSSGTGLGSQGTGPGSTATVPSLSAQPGDPVALLSIPAIGVSNMVVVEGTSPENLTLGPGHLRDSPFPGQAGISVIFGRRASFGGPFSNLPSLHNGDLITTLGAQGIARYQVIAVSESSKPVPFSEISNQLLLVTADSKIAPAHYVEVEAKLLSTPFQESGYFPTVTSAENALGRDYYALIPAMAWAIALAAAALLGSVLASRWARWPAWIVAIPVIVAVIWNLYESLTALLPNLY